MKTPNKTPRRETRKTIALILSVLTISLSISIPFSQAQTYSITYDANGNRQSAFGYYYEYNSFNQLSRVRQSNSTGTILEEYLYDSHGQRVYKNEPQKGQETFYFGKDFVRIVNSSGTFDTIYYYDEDTFVAREEFDSKSYFYHPDHLGSTTLITNESGSVVEETTYEPFGNVFSGGNDRFLYTGKERDQGTGLEYYGARYYDPPYQIFTQPDSNLPNPYDPQQLNRYAYTRNNPYRYTDPDGNALNIIAGAGIGAAIGAGFSLYSQLSAGVSIDQVNWADVGKAAAVGAVAGGVAGLTMGGSIVAGALVGAASGQAARATSNVLEGREITQGLGNPQDITIDTITGGIASGASGAISALRGGGAAAGAESAPLRGAANPDIRAAINYGQQQHAAFYEAKSAQGFITNKAIPGSGGLRPDAYDPTAKIVIELKPNSESGFLSGNRQLQDYVKALENSYGGKWTSKLQTYTPLKKK